MITAALLLQGCTTAKAVYESFKEIELTDEELKLLSEGKLTYDVEHGRGDFENYGDYLKYRAYQYITAGSGFLKGKVPTYIVISWVIGLVMFFLSRKAIKVRKMALIVFGFGIPALLFLLLYGSAFLADALK